MKLARGTKLDFLQQQWLILLPLCMGWTPLIWEERPMLPLLRGYIAHLLDVSKGLFTVKASNDLVAHQLGR